VKRDVLATNMRGSLWSADGYRLIPRLPGSALGRGNAVRQRRVQTAKQTCASEGRAHLLQTSFNIAAVEARFREGTLVSSNESLWYFDQEIFHKASPG